MEKNKQLDEITEMIKSTLNDCSSETGEKQFMAEQIILQVICWGSTNCYEGIGILENAKIEWRETVESNLE